MDLGNLFSLETGHPLSLLDLDRALAGGEALEIREGRPGERHAFNAAGQEIDVAGLLGLARAGGPMLGNPVKDSMEAKTTPDTQNVVAAIYATRRLASPVEVGGMARALGLLLREHGRAGAVRSWVLPEDAAARPT